jgi:trehalose 6-phosphate synthase
MNLVAKEFVCARDDERGVLVLSRFAGAATQLDAALLIDPYEVDESMSALGRALTMPVAEQSARMRRLRTNVARFNAAWWAQQIIGDCAHVAQALPRNCSPAVVRYQVKRDQLGQESADSHLST